MWIRLSHMKSIPPLLQRGSIYLHTRLIRPCHLVKFLKGILLPAYCKEYSFPGKEYSFPFELHDCWQGWGQGCTF